MESYRNFLKKLLQRPGMYVGANRLDYIYHFLSGYSYANAADWNEDYDLQMWFLKKHSASLRTAVSLRGSALLFGCFGNGEAGIQACWDFLDSVPFSTKQYRLEDTVSHQIFAIYSHYAHSDLEDLSEPYTAFPSSLLPFSEAGMLALARAATEYPMGDLILYICLRSQFMLVRIVCDTGEGWEDITQKITDGTSIQNLLLLHAYAELLLGVSNQNGKAHWDGTVVIQQSSDEIFVTKTPEVFPVERRREGFQRIWDTTECEAMIPQFLQWKQDLA